MAAPAQAAARPDRAAAARPDRAAAARPYRAAAARPTTTGIISVYDDPCETTSTPDLRDLAVDDLFGGDRRTVQDGAVRFEATFCRPVADADARLRVELFPRLDTPQGPDYSESPSRTLLIAPTGSGWQWKLTDTHGTVASGTAAAPGSGGARTAVWADVDACAVAAASGVTCDADRQLPGAPPGPTPPLALRACSADVDCGPAYRTVDGRTTDDTNQVRSDVDYLPDPAHLQVTYPSVCQTGGTAQGPSAQAPDQVVVEQPEAHRLLARGWRPQSVLPDGSVRFRADPAEAARLAGADAVHRVGLLRHRAAAPDDPWFASDGPGAPTGQWSLERVGVLQAWDVTEGVGQVRVAILDSGLDARHPDLAGAAVAVRDFVPTRYGSSSRPLDRAADTDLSGHGTFVASQVSARTDNGVGMAGLAPGVGLLVARVFDAEGCASDAAVVDAMSWATSQGADVINLSLGSETPSSLLRTAGEDAVARGAVPVAAAGNAGRTVEDYPAAYESYVSVAATGYIDPEATSDDPVAPYSTQNTHIELAAPGGTNRSGYPERDVLGACWTGPSDGRGYCRSSGTSFASPLVAGAFALARSAQPDRTVPGLRQLLADTAHDIGPPGRDEDSGYGRIDVGRALRLLGARADTLDRGLDRSADATTVAVAVSQRVFAAGSARIGVLARRDVYADALAGASLSRDRGPLLLTGRDHLDGQVSRELRRALPQGSTVYLLGGTAALSPAVESAVRSLGYTTQRLAGRSRVETAEAIARAVGAPDGRALVASATNWPDAVAGGIYAAHAGVPLLLTWPSGADEAHTPGLRTTLADLGVRDVTLLGGTAALPDRVASTLADRFSVTRTAGVDRFATAASIVTDLWGRRTGQPGDRYVVVNGTTPNGWALALAATPLAARDAAPLLLVADGLVTAEPSRLLRSTEAYRLDRSARATAIGPLTVAGDSGWTAQRLRELLGG